MRIFYILLVFLLVPMVSAVNITKNIDENIITNHTTYLKFTIIPGIDNYYDGDYWPETVKLSLFTDRSDNNLSISGCGNSYYTTVSIEGIKIISIPIVAYYPTDYTINYTLEGKHNKESYLMNIHATGNITDFNASTIFCPKMNISQLNNSNYKRRVRYGFDPTVNLPRERLKNHSLGLDKIVVNTTNITTVNISQPIQLENISNTTIIVDNTNKTNISVITNNQENVNTTKNYFVIITIIIIIIISGVMYGRYYFNR